MRCCYRDPNEDGDCPIHPPKHPPPIDDPRLDAALEFIRLNHPLRYNEMHQFCSNVPVADTCLLFFDAGADFVKQEERRRSLERETGVLTNKRGVQISYEPAGTHFVQTCTLCKTRLRSAEIDDHDCRNDEVLQELKDHKVEPSGQQAKCLNCGHLFPVESMRCTNCGSALVTESLGERHLPQMKAKYTREHVQNLLTKGVIDLREYDVMVAEIDVRDLILNRFRDALPATVRVEWASPDIPFEGMEWTLDVWGVSNPHAFYKEVGGLRALLKEQTDRRLEFVFRTEEGNDDGSDEREETHRDDSKETPS